MHTRNMRIKLRADSVQEFGRLFRHKIIPLLRAQKGFNQEITLVAAERNEVLVISFWDNQENADAYDHLAYLDVLRALSRVVEDMPVVETFEFADPTPDEIGASAA